MGKVMLVPISQIRENPVALRAVSRESEQFQGLVDSIRVKGFFGAITVREKTDPESKISFYELIDGLHRYAAAKEAGIQEINVDILSMDDATVLETQVMANIHKIETRAHEYSQQLRRMLAANPLMTEAELAEKLAKSTQWIKDRLDLNKIENPEVAKLVDEGTINLTNAYALAKLPADEQVNYVEQAMQESPQEFVPKINARVKEIKDARRRGEEESTIFVPAQYAQKLGDIKAEVESGKIAAALIKQTGITDAIGGFKLALQWVLHYDPMSIKAQKEKFDQTQAEKIGKREAAAKAKADKLAAKAKEASDAAAKAQAVLAGKAKK